MWPDNRQGHISPQSPAAAPPRGNHSSSLRLGTLIRWVSQAPEDCGGLRALWLLLLTESSQKAGSWGLICLSPCFSLPNCSLTMAERSHGPGNPQGGQEKSRREILRSTKRVWTPLDEQLPPGSEEESQSVIIPTLGENRPSGLLKTFCCGCWGSWGLGWGQMILEQTLGFEDPVFLAGCYRLLWNGYFWLPPTHIQNTHLLDGNRPTSPFLLQGPLISSSPGPWRVMESMPDTWRFLQNIKHSIERLFLLGLAWSIRNNFNSLKSRK